METTLEHLLATHSFKKINSIDEFKKYINIDDIDDDGSPKIIIDHKTVIIFDCEDFNSTYLIDQVNNYLNIAPSITENISKLYIDSIDLKIKIFKPKRQLSEFSSPVEFERVVLSPGLMFINPINNLITWHDEQLGFSEKRIQHCFEFSLFTDGTTV